MAKIPKSIRKALKGRPNIEERAVRRTNRELRRATNRAEKRSQGQTARSKANIEERAVRRATRSFNTAMAHADFQDAQVKQSRAIKAASRYVKAINKKDFEKAETLFAPMQKRNEELKNSLKEVKANSLFNNKKSDLNKVLKPFEKTTKQIEKSMENQQFVEQEAAKDRLFKENSRPEYKASKEDKDRIQEEEKLNTLSGLKGEDPRRIKNRDVRQQIGLNNAAMSGGDPRRNTEPDIITATFDNKHTVSEADIKRLKLDKRDADALSKYVPKTKKEAQFLKDRIQATLQTREHGYIPTELLESKYSEMDAHIKDFEYHETVDKLKREIKKSKWQTPVLAPVTVAPFDGATVEADPTNDGDRFNTLENFTKTGKWDKPITIKPSDIWDEQEHRYKNLVEAVNHFNRMSAGEEGFYPGENANSMMTMEDKSLIDVMPEDEKQVYNYLFYTKGETEANEYLEGLRNKNTEREAEQYAENMSETDNVLYDLLAASAQGTSQFVSGLAGAVDATTGNESDYSGLDVISNATSKRREKMGGFSGFMFDTVSTFSNMAPSMALGMITGGTAGTALMSISAGGNSYREMIDQGYSDNQARAYGLVTGALEGTLQSVLGGVGGMTGSLVRRGASGLANKFTGMFSRGVAQRLTQMAGEFTEESLQDIFAPLVKSVFTGADVDINLGDALYSGLMGATMAFGSGGIESIAQRSAKAKNAGSTEDIIDEIDKYDTRYRDGKNLKNAIDTGAEKINGLSTLAQLYDYETKRGKVGMNDRAENSIELAISKGNISDSDADVLKEALLRDMRGESVSPEGRMMLQSEQGLAVAADALDTMKLNSRQDNAIEKVANAVMKKNTPVLRQATTKLLTGQELTRSETALLEKNSETVEAQVSRIMGVASSVSLAEINPDVVQARASRSLALTDNFDSTSTQVIDRMGKAHIVQTVGDDGTIATVDGNTFSMDEVSFPSQGYMELMELAQTLPVEEREGFLKYTTPEMSAEENYDRYLQIKDLASEGIPLDLILSENSTYELNGMSEDAVRNAYKAGVRSRESAEPNAQYGQEGQTVEIDPSVDTSDKENLSRIKVLEAMSDMFGYNVRVINDPDGNSSYGNNTLTINLADSDSLGWAFTQTVSHEMVHWGKENAPTEYFRYTQEVLKYLNEKGIDIEYEIDTRMNMGMSREVAIDEIVAEAGETISEYSQAISTMSKTEGIGEFIKRVYSRVKTFFENLFTGKVDKFSDITRVVSESTQEELQNVINAYDDMLVRSADNARQLNLEEVESDTTDTGAETNAEEETSAEETKEKEEQKQEEEFEPSDSDLSEIEEEQSDNYEDFERDVLRAADVDQWSDTDYEDDLYNSDDVVDHYVNYYKKNDDYYRMNKKQREIYDSLRSREHRDEMSRLVDETKKTNGRKISNATARQIVRTLAKDVYNRKPKGIRALEDKAIDAFENYYEMLSKTDGDVSPSEAFAIFYDTAKDIIRDDPGADLNVCVENILEAYADADKVSTYADKQRAKTEAVKANERIKRENLEERIRKQSKERIQRMREFFKKRIEREHVVKENANLRNKLVRKIERLMKKTASTVGETSKVPAEIKNGLAQVLQGINMYSSNGRAIKLNNEMKALQDKLQTIATDPDYAQLAEQWALDVGEGKTTKQYTENIWSLTDDIKKLNELMSLYNRSLNPNNYVRDIGKNSAVKTVDYLQVEQSILSLANQIATTVETGISRVNKLKQKERYYSRAERAGMIADDIQSVKGRTKTPGVVSGLGKLGSFMDDTRLPLPFIMEKIVGFKSNSELIKAVNRVIAAQSDFQMLQMKWQKEFKPETKADQKAFTNFLEDTVETQFIDSNTGEKVSMTRAEISELALTYEREAHHLFLHHLTSGALLLNREVFAKKGRAAAESAGISIDPNSITEENIANALSKFNEWDIKMLRKVQNFMRNEVPEERSKMIFKERGYKPQSEEYYYPEQTPRGQRGEDIGQYSSIDFTAPWEHALNPDANQQAVIGSCMLTVFKMIDSVAMKTQMMPAVNDLNALLNTQALQGKKLSRDTLREIIAKKWGTKMSSLIMDRLENVVNPKSNYDMAEQMFLKMISFYQSANVAFNIGSMMKIGASGLMVRAYVSNDAYLKGYKNAAKRIKSKNGFKNLCAEIDEHSASHFMRAEGVSLGDLINLSKNQAEAKKLTGSRSGENAVKKGARTVFEFLRDAPGNMLTAIDSFGTALPWECCKLEAEKQLGKDKVGTEAYWKLTSKLYEKFINETQSSNNDLFNPGVTQSNANIAFKALTPFKNEEFKSGALGIYRVQKAWALRREYLSDKTEANKKAYHDAVRDVTRLVQAQACVIGAMATASVLSLLLKGAALHYGKKEDEESFAEMVLHAFLSETISMTMTLFSPIILGAADSFVNYDKITIPFFTDALDVSKMFVKLANGELKDYEGAKLVRQAITSGLRMFGVPANTINKSINGVLNIIDSIKDGKFHYNGRYPTPLDSLVQEQMMPQLEKLQGIEKEIKKSAPKTEPETNIWSSKYVPKRK